MANELKTLEELAAKLEQTEKSLHHSEARFRNVIIRNADGMIVIDQEGVVRFANPAAGQLFGLKNGSLVGEPFGFPILGGEKAELDLLRHDGLSVIVEMRIEETEWEGKKAFLASLRDITERKQAEAALEQYSQHLEELVTERTAELETAYTHLHELDHLKDEFINTISHELRTPITNLKLYLHLLTIRPHKSISYMETLRRETGRLENIVEGILEVTQLAESLTTMASIQVDVNALVNKTIENFTSLTEEHTVTLLSDTKSELPSIKGDPALLTRALSILLTNAFHYTPAGGQIQISTCTEKHQGQTGACIQISDTGSGIPADERPYLFERFFRGRVALGSGIPGAGLGLFVVKQIVQQHQGYIKVESEGTPGQGTTFSLWLPIQKPSAN